MKKWLVLVAVAGIAYVAYRKFIQDQEERDLWAEVTDNL
ncbi:MAG: DLW-39 family protein [Micrococcales bacterium]|nr:DLW-39 family protein [Micrococcales bacterium]